MIETWQAAAGIAASAVMTAGTAVAVVRHMLRSDFVPRGTHSALEQRVNGLERQMATMPSEHDMADLTRRLGAVETGVAVVQTTVEGVNAGMKRVEHTVGLLLRHQLQRNGE